MDSELATLAATGATTLVSLMATDSWIHARELVARFLARIGADAAAIAGLGNARTRLLITDATSDEQAITATWSSRPIPAVLSWTFAARRRPR
ncbi:hypothetical protein SNOUR_07325 [Streptomyces noursei ATCC 11455]|nr:hypothetical protein SNOUR_07325 [Streptomyces noursei ATCC 11455]